MNRLSGRNKEARNGDGIPFLAAARFLGAISSHGFYQDMAIFMTQDFSISINIME